MDEYKIKDCSLIQLTEQQMQIRGGVAWREAFRIARYIQMIFDFIEDYKKDMERGFDKGWRMF